MMALISTAARCSRGMRTVSGTLTTELRSLLKQDVHLLWAGRTDSGVHADDNVCTYDVRIPMPVNNLARMLNNSLPPDIRITDQWVSESDWHPRFDAVRRTYVYRIWNGVLPPVDKIRYVAAIEKQIDIREFRKSAELFLGKHCFRSFCRKPEDGDDCICELYANQR